MKLPKMNGRFLFFFVCTIELLHYVPSLLANPIINAYAVNPGNDQEYTYHVSIHHRPKGYHDFQYICGGSIIGESHILTAAHCFMNKVDYQVKKSVKPERTKIIAGTNQRVGSGVERAIITVYIPIQFNTVRNEFTGDIAVLRLKDGLGISEHQTTMRIMPTLSLPFTTVMDQEARFCGFGQDVPEIYNAFGSPRFFADVKRYIKMKILSNDLCPNFETKICARHSDTEPSSPCNGDAGGALIYQNRIVGVLSQEPPGCKDHNGPAVFTRILGLTAFIALAQEDNADHSIMHVLGKDPSSHRLVNRLRAQLRIRNHG